MEQNYLPDILAKPPMPCDCQRPEGCEKTGIQYADITVPFEVKPTAKIGKIEVECSGEPKVTCRKKHESKGCEIVVVQKVCLRLPIHYEVTACAGESKLECNDCCK